MKTLLLSLVAAIVFTGASAQGIRTIGGNGYVDYSGNNGSATAAQFYSCYAVAKDDSGNMYVLDQGNNCIRKVNTSGIVSTYAGTTTIGYSGDGGYAKNAELNQPSGIATDAFGNLYIADEGNNRIRMVKKSTGIITTVAGRGLSGFKGDGGPADSAEISGPTGIAVDAAGNIYITDAANLRIRMVVSGTINTIAGKGIQGFSGDGAAAIYATFNKPAGIAIDNLGNIYIADVGNNRIRKINSSGTISTFAGNGTPGFFGDGGYGSSAELNKPNAVAADAKGNVYIADRANNRVRMVNSSGVISTFAGTGWGSYSGDGGPAASAEINNPTGLAVDDSGSVFVADNRNFIIRRIDTTGTITTAAGDGLGGYSEDGGMATMASVRFPNGLALDNSGNVYVADGINNVVRKIKTSGVIVTVAGNGTAGYGGVGGSATAAGLSSPVGVSVDALGNIYIADAGNNCVRKVDTTSGLISTIAGTGIAGFIGDGAAATSAELDYPCSVTTDAAGDIYIADLNNIRVRKIDAVGNISTIAGNGVRGYSGDNMPATSTALSSPGGIALDASGNLYIADYGEMMIRRVNPAGTIHTVVGSGFVGFSGDGGKADTAMLNAPSAVTVDASGDIYIADQDNNRIRKVTAAGVISTVAGNGKIGYSGDYGLATKAWLNKPTGVAVDVSGNIFIADNNNHRIREVSNSFPTEVQSISIPNTTGVSLYPNPNSGRFTIKSTGVSGGATVEIYNIIGEKIYSKQLSIVNGGALTSSPNNNATSNCPLSIDISSNPAGIYLYRVLSANNELIGQGKFIKE